MATKKQNRRTTVRKTRRVLNRTAGEIKWTRKGILGSRYGDGLNRRSIRIFCEDRDDDT